VTSIGLGDLSVENTQRGVRWRIGPGLCVDRQGPLGVDALRELGGDPGAFDSGWNMSCGYIMSPATIMHTGYTGTEVCSDPNFATGPLITVLLTNRVYPTDTTGSAKVHLARQLYNDAVARVLHPTLRPGLLSHPPEALL